MKRSPFEDHVACYSTISSYELGIAFLRIVENGKLFNGFELADFLFAVSEIVSFRSIFVLTKLASSTGGYKFLTLTRRAFPVGIRVAVRRGMKFPGFRRLYPAGTD